MKIGGGLIGVGVAAWAFAYTAQPSPHEQRPVLRSITSSVAVHVLVSNERGAVRGLTASDFVLTDSGIRQDIATMTVDPLPLDVTVVLEQLQQSEYASRDRHPHVEEVEQLLDAGDRLRLLSVGTDVLELVPLSAPGSAADAKPPTPSDVGSVYDGLASALMRPSAVGRQHVIVVVSEAYDAMSFTSPESLMELAERSDAQVHLLMAEGRRIKSRTLARLPVPAVRDDGLELLVTLARATGGNYIQPSRLTRSIREPVRRLLDEVRAGYVLYYSPKGVPEGGWHPITVTISRPGPFEVRARPGYAN